jgi:hypothetical protein
LQIVFTCLDGLKYFCPFCLVSALTLNEDGLIKIAPLKETDKLMLNIQQGCDFSTIRRYRGISNICYAYGVNSSTYNVGNYKLLD